MLRQPSYQYCAYVKCHMECLIIFTPSFHFGGVWAYQFSTWSTIWAYVCPDTSSGIVTLRKQKNTAAYLALQPADTLKPTYSNWLSWDHIPRAEPGVAAATFEIAQQAPRRAYANKITRNHILTPTLASVIRPVAQARRHTHTSTLTTIHAHSPTWRRAPAKTQP